MKPDWKDAPEWANWLAVDYDGTWRWWQVEPWVEGTVWWNEGDGRELEAVVRSDAWESSLEKRPEAK